MSDLAHQPWRAQSARLGRWKVIAADAPIPSRLWPHCPPSPQRPRQSQLGLPSFLPVAALALFNVAGHRAGRARPRYWQLVSTDVGQQTPTCTYLHRSASGQRKIKCVRCLPNGAPGGGRTNHRDHGADPTSTLAAATSARQAFAAGGGYLLTALSDEPATSPDLAGPVRRLAGVFQQLAVNYLAEVGDAALDPLLRAGDEATLTIQQLCK